MSEQPPRLTPEQSAAYADAGEPHRTGGVTERRFFADEVRRPQKPVGMVDPNPEKEAAWQEEWEANHSQRHQSFVTPGGMGGRKPPRVLNFDHPSVKVILDLERQINGGRELSKPK